MVVVPLSRSDCEQVHEQGHITGLEFLSATFKRTLKGALLNHRTEHNVSLLLIHRHGNGRFARTFRLPHRIRFLIRNTQ